MISQNLLDELRIIIKEDYGKDLEMKEIAQIANNLVDYFNLLAKIYHQIKTQNDDDEDTNN